MGYKMKSHSGAKKRFRFTKNGKIKRGHAYKSHIMTKFSSKRVRQLRGAEQVSKGDEKRVKELLPYGGR